LAGYLQILVDWEEQGELKDAEQRIVGNLRILKVVLIEIILELLEDESDEQGGLHYHDPGCEVPDRYDGLVDHCLVIVC
jgi:hypothetical protein